MRGQRLLSRLAVATARTRWSLLLVVAPAWCGRGDEPFDGQVSRSQFFEYHDQVQEQLCPTLPSWLDRHAEVIGGKVGLIPDMNDPYRYYKFRDAAAYAAFAPSAHGCPPETSACALGDTVYATTSFHAHEQAHDYVFRAWGGWSDGLLIEGEAVALSCSPFAELEPGQRPVDIVGSLDWRDLPALYLDSDEEYLAAGFFVTYLAERYGWPSVQKLHQKVPRGASADVLERAFADVYPTSIDQAWADALRVPGAPPCQRDWQCLVTSPMTVGEVAAPDCDGEMHRSVEVGAQGGAVLSMEGDDPRLMLLPCAASTPTSYTLEGGHAGRPATHWASLPPGVYAMFPGPLPASVALRSYFPGALVGGSCDSASPVSLDPNGRTSVDFLPGGVDGWMRLAGGGRTYDVFPYNLMWNDLLTPGPVSICHDCSGASCVPLPYGQATRVVIGDQSVVRFQGALSLPPPSAAWSQLVFDVSPANLPRSVSAPARAAR